MDGKLETQIRLWENLNNYLNEREDVALKSALALITVAGAFFIVDEKSELRVILYYLAPLVMILILSYISYLFRFVAVLRGYLSALEEDINTSSETESFMWNKDYIKAFISNNVPNIVIMICALLIATFVIVWIVLSALEGSVKLNSISIFKGLNDASVNLLNYIYFPSLVILLILLLYSFMDNNYIAKASYNLYKSKSINDAIKDCKKLFKIGLSIKKRMK